MSTVTGQLGRQHPAAQALGFRPIQPGRFVFRQIDDAHPLPKHLIRQIPTAYECPYCHEALCRLDPTQGVYTGRAVKMVGHERMIVEPIPVGVIPLKCVACDVHFSVLAAAAPAP